MTKKLAPEDHRLDAFDHGVKGVEPIAPGGTDVPDAKLAAVEEAAESAGVRLVEIDAATGEAEPVVNATDGALRVARENGVDLSGGPVEGTLEGGRISQSDVEKHVAAQEAAAAGAGE